jgi:hypothetical protein
MRGTEEEARLERIVREVERAVWELFGERAERGEHRARVTVYRLAGAPRDAGFCAVVGSEPGLSTLAEFGANAQSALLSLLREVGRLRRFAGEHADRGDRRRRDVVAGPVALPAERVERAAHV